MEVEIATSATWAYIHDQLDRSKKFKVHIAGLQGKAFCGTRGAKMDEYGSMELEQYKTYVYACKKCLKKYLKTPG